MKKLRVTVEGKTYDVLVEMFDEATPGVAVAPAAIAAAAAPSPVVVAAPPATVPKEPVPSRAVAGAADVVSPLAGKVVSIDVSVGQAVAEGVQVATLEAMKMNTYVYASRAGRVTAIAVHAGDGVDEGAVLVHMD